MPMIAMTTSELDERKPKRRRTRDGCNHETLEEPLMPAADCGKDTRISVFDRARPTSR